MPFSAWKYKQAYETKNYQEVEKLSHKYLKDYKDTDAPIGEVFKCSVDIAIKAIEDALKDLGLFDDAVKVEVLEKTWLFKDWKRLIIQLSNCFILLLEWI